MKPAGNVVPFERRCAALAFAAGVPPFDPSNPRHVRAWNALFALGRQEASREGRS